MKSAGGKREGVTVQDGAETSSRAAPGPHTLVLEEVTPATRLLEKRRQVFEVQEALLSQKAEFERNEEVFKRRETALKSKDAELQESLIRFSKFLQENDLKRARAEKKASEEIAVRAQKEQELEQLEELFDECRRLTVQEGEVAKKNGQYQGFLERVLEASHDFTEMNDVIVRFAALEATNRDLTQHSKEVSEGTDRTRSELQQYVKQAADEILYLNNRISVLKKELETREKDVMALSGTVDSTLQVMCQKTLEHGQVCMAADNLYHQCSKRSHISRPTYSHPLEQLGVIQDYVNDLTFIAQEIAKNKAEPKAAAAAAPAPSAQPSAAKVA